MSSNISRRSFVQGTAAATAALIATGCAQQGASGTGSEAGSAAGGARKLAIVHTNDTHGHDLLDEESLGLAAAVQLVHDYEAQGYDVLLLDAGDVTQGRSLVNHSQGDAAIEMLNECGYQAMALGNHEFDFGQDKVAAFAEAAHFPILSANVLVDATGELLVEPNVVLEAAGKKVGVFGLTTPSTQTDANPLLVQGLTFLQGEELYACAQEQADALRAQGCDLVVCLAHLGEEEAVEPSRATDVVAHTTGIDLVINGHDHEEENALVANADGQDVLIVETGCFTHAVGVVTWEDGAPVERLEAFGSYEGQDAPTAAFVQEISDQVDEELSEVVATTEFALDGTADPGLRTQEMALGDLVADALLWEAELMADVAPDASIVNGGGIRDSIDAGDITIGEVLDVLPFINYVYTTQITGAQLLEALEAATQSTPEAIGAFPQVAGITMKVDTTVPFESNETYPNSTYSKPAKPGARVTVSDVGGRGFSPDDTYTIACSDFICAGGDTYHVFGEAASSTMRGIGYQMYECLRYFLEEACAGQVPPEYTEPQGRVTVTS